MLLFGKVLYACLVALCTSYTWDESPVVAAAAIAAASAAVICTESGAHTNIMLKAQMRKVYWTAQHACFCNLHQRFIAAHTFKGDVGNCRFIAAHKKLSDWLFASLICGFGLPLSFFLWYFNLYKGAIRDTGFRSDSQHVGRKWQHCIFMTMQ